MCRQGPSCKLSRSVRFPVWPVKASSLLSRRRGGEPGWIQDHRPGIDQVSHYNEMSTSDLKCGADAACCGAAAGSLAGDCGHCPSAGYPHNRQSDKHRGLTPCQRSSPESSCSSLSAVSDSTKDPCSCRFRFPRVRTTPGPRGGRGGSTSSVCSAACTFEPPPTVRIHCVNVDQLVPTALARSDCWQHTMMQRAWILLLLLVQVVILPARSQHQNDGSGSGSTSISIPASAPDGGISMTQPAQTGDASFYKIASGEKITFGWNYTSVIITPSTLQISAFCSANAVTYNLGGVSSGATEFVFDPGQYNQQAPHSQLPQLMQASYRLMISNPDVTAPGPGVVASNSKVTFAMYKPQAYTPLSGTSPPPPPCLP